VDDALKRAAPKIRSHRYLGNNMIIRAAILVFALMFYMMVNAGAPLMRTTPSAAGTVSLAGAQETATRLESTDAPPAAGTERAAREKGEERMSSGFLKIWPESHPEAMQQRDFSRQGRMRLPLTDASALQNLTYADAERAISEELTGESGRHGSQMKVRQALILGCGLMMREARGMGAEGKGKYEKLDRYRPMGDSPLLAAPRFAERTY
jgi:hypothetical protein